MRLTETADPDDSIFTGFYHFVDSGFNTCKGIHLNQYHIVARGHGLASVDFEPWSPAAWFGGGVCLF